MIATRIGVVRAWWPAPAPNISQPGVARRRPPTSSITTALGSMRPACRAIGSSRRTALKSRRPFDRGSSSALQRLRCRRQSSVRGITRVMSYKMEAARRTGALVIVLEEFEREPLPVHIVYTERKPMPLKLRVFLDWLTPRLKARRRHTSVSCDAASRPAVAVQLRFAMFICLGRMLRFRSSRRDRTFPGMSEPAHCAHSAYGRLTGLTAPSRRFRKPATGRELSVADYLPTVGAKPSAPPFQALAQIAIRSTSSSVISSPVRS